MLYILLHRPYRSLVYTISIMYASTFCFFFIVSSLVSFARGKEGIERKIRVSMKEEKEGTKL